MKKKFLSTLFFLLLINCGFSPINLKSQKPIAFTKIEITGEKEVVFDLERKLKLQVNEKDDRGYILKAQVFQSSETSATDSRGIATEENLKLNFTFQVFDKNNTVLYQDNLFKDKKISIGDNMNNNQQIRNSEKRILLDGLVDIISFRLRANLN
jgi:outer membrane lipopolysaccharide assembly protein LptE/RlpB